MDYCKVFGRLTGINQSLLESLLNFNLFRTLMIRLITRVVLSLCILLSTGYSQLYSHEMEDGHQYAQFESANQSANATFSSDQLAKIPVLQIHSPGKIKLDPTEIEEKDDILILFKKYVEISNYFTAIFCTLILGFLFRFIQKSLFLSKHFHHITSYRKHLIIQVFTI